MINEYMFYTAEGFTTAPNEGYEVDNCQVLGRALGNSVDEAKRNLLKDSTWIVEAGFNPDEFMVVQLAREQFLYNN